MPPFFIYAAGVDKPPRRFDPLVAAFILIAVTTILAIAAYVVYRPRGDEGLPPRQDEQAAEKGAAEIRAWLESQKKAAAPPPAPAAKAAAATPGASHCSSPPLSRPLPAPRAVVWQLGDEGRRWRYRVTVDAPVSWADATLTYSMHDSIASQIVQAEFARGETRSSFRVGYFVAGHPSHADMRFPGFFMLPVHLDRPLENGARFTWQTPWPLNHTMSLRQEDASLAVGWMWHVPQLRREPGRIKRYDAVVKQWEEMDTPLGKVTAVCIEATLSYMEESTTRASVRETYWYAPSLAAVVKAMREGEAPDESARRITVELLAIEPRGFEFVDMRPPKDKMRSDPGDGSLVAGDADFTPDRLSLVRQHLNAVVAGKLAGKRVEVGRLVTYYVRTPKTQMIERGAGLAPMPAEQYFDLPKLRSFPYWVVCWLELSVDGRALAGRGIVGFAGEPDFPAQHRRALIGAVNEAILKL